VQSSSVLYSQYFFFLIREDLRKLFDSLNKWKNELKQNGILVDGKHYHVKFKGTFFHTIDWGFLDLIPYITTAQLVWN